MSIDALQTLCTVRAAAEQEAEQQLARATAQHQQQREHQARLAAELEAARARRDQVRRDDVLTPGSAAEIQTRLRYAARLDAAVAAAQSELGRHAQGPLAAAAAAVERARADHLRARQRREAVERAIARRQAAARRDQDRRAQAVADDLAQRRRS
jgi:flagellar biosynthesis chaperone FliJ